MSQADDIHQVKEYSKNIPKPRVKTEEDRKEGNKASSRNFMEDASFGDFYRRNKSSLRLPAIDHNATGGTNQCASLLFFQANKEHTPCLNVLVVLKH